MRWGSREVMTYLNVSDLPECEAVALTLHVESCGV